MNVCWVNESRLGPVPEWWPSSSGASEAAPSEAVHLENAADTGAEPGCDPHAPLAGRGVRATPPLGSRSFGVQGPCDENASLS